jgi:hypothetical protein
VPIAAGGWSLSPALLALRYLDLELLGQLLLADLAPAECWLQDRAGGRLRHCPLAAVVQRRDLALADRRGLIRLLLELGADPRDRWGRGGQGGGSGGVSLIRPWAAALPLMGGHSGCVRACLTAAALEA